MGNYLLDLPRGMMSQQSRVDRQHLGRAEPENRRPPAWAATLRPAYRNVQVDRASSLGQRRSRDIELGVVAGLQVMSRRLGY